MLLGRRYIEPQRAEKLKTTGRALLARTPAFVIVGLILWAFIADPVWPYHLLSNSFTESALRLMGDPEYRTYWVEHWSAVYIVLGFLFITLAICLKLGVWNKAFKTLKVRTRDQQDKIETEIGRAYWIEGWSGQGFLRFVVGLLRTLHIIDLRVGKPAGKYRVMKRGPKDLAVLGLSRAGGETDWVLKQTSSANGVLRLNIQEGKLKKRTIFYKPTFWPPINPFILHRSMHRLIIDCSNDAIAVHDGSTILVEGANLKRDLSKDYPTFELTSEGLAYSALDLQHYKGTLDDDIQKSTFITQQASQMDTFLLKDQRKFQEISVPVNPQMANLVKGGQ